MNKASARRIRLVYGIALSICAIVAGVCLITACLGIYLSGGDQIYTPEKVAHGFSVISVPVYLLAGLPTHFALGTNKLSSGIGTAASTFRYLKNGFVDWALAIPSVVFALVGAHLGTKLQIALDERYLKYLLLIVLPVVAFVMLKQKKFPEEKGEINPWLQRAIVWGASFIVGAYDGFYGPGTGTFLLLIFCNFAKMDLRTASGNVKVVNFSSNIGALATSLMAGKVLIPVGLIAAVFSIAGHYLGAGLTIKNGARIVRPVIFVVLILLALKVLLELLGI